MIAIPIVCIQMYNHRNQREKDRLAEAITENIEREVIIVFTEPAHGNWYFRYTSLEIQHYVSKRK